MLYLIPQTYLVANYGFFKFHGCNITIYSSPPNISEGLVLSFIIVFNRIFLFMK